MMAVCRLSKQGRLSSLFPK